MVKYSTIIDITIIYKICIDMILFNIIIQNILLIFILDIFSPRDFYILILLLYKYILLITIKLSPYEYKTINIFNIYVFFLLFK